MGNYGSVKSTELLTDDGGSKPSFNYKFLRNNRGYVHYCLRSRPGSANVVCPLVCDNVEMLTE